MLVHYYFLWMLFLLYLGSILSTISCSGLKKVAQMWTPISRAGKVKESPLPSCYQRTRSLPSSPNPTIRACNSNWSQTRAMQLQTPWNSPTTDCRASARNEMTNLTWLFVCISYHPFFLFFSCFVLFICFFSFWPYCYLLIDKKLAK